METELEVKIKKLKQANVALDVALEYDNCVDSEKAEEIIENLFDYNLEELREILNTYQGYSCSDLNDLISTMIHEL